MQEFAVKLSKIINEFKLEEVYVPNPEILIETTDINRPGLQIAGFFDYFDPKRIQVMGMVENTYLSSLSDEERTKRIDDFFSRDIPVVVFTREMEIGQDIIEIARKYETNILI